MSRIFSKNTKPELIVRKYLFSRGFRYRKNDRRYPGCPDIVLPKYKTVVFINGCFWHMHEGNPCFVMPRSNQDYWNNKLKRNKQRDEENAAILRNLGWHVIVVWECALSSKLRESTLVNLYESIRESCKYNQILPSG